MPLTGLPALALRVAVAMVCAELSFRCIEQPVRDGALTRLWVYHFSVGHDPLDITARPSDGFAARISFIPDTKSIARCNFEREAHQIVICFIP